MKAIKAIFQNGKIKFTEKPADTGPVEVLVVFPEPAIDPWEKILNDPTPRPKLNRLVNQVKKEIAQGKAQPLDLNDL